MGQHSPAKLGAKVPTGFVPPMRIPRTMGQMPFIGGSGTAVVNEATHARGLNAGYSQEDINVTQDSPVNSGMNGVARNSPGKTKKKIFGV